MAQSTLGQTKPIPVGVKVEAEGGSTGQGMFIQDAKDITPGEVKSLESLVTTELKKKTLLT